MSWGKGILITCVVFVAGIALMVYKSFTGNIDLVTKNYYEEEIKYQQQINKINNTNNLQENVTIELAEDNIIISYPGSNTITGEIALYRPSDAGKDFKVPVSAGTDSKQYISTVKMAKGFWRIKINWNMNGIGYYIEEKIIIR